VKYVSPFHISDWKGYYKKLGFDPNLNYPSSWEIRQAFRQILKAKKLTDKEFEEVFTAYETLKESASQMLYDISDFNLKLVNDRAKTPKKNRYSFYKDFTGDVEDEKVIYYLNAVGLCLNHLGITQDVRIGFSHESVNYATRTSYGTVYFFADNSVLQSLEYITFFICYIINKDRWYELQAKALYGQKE